MRWIPATWAAAWLACSTVSFAAEETYDVVVYGGTSAAVTAAVQAKMMGRSVVIVSPDKHLGGLSSGGPGWPGPRLQEVSRGPAPAFYPCCLPPSPEPPPW